MTDQLIRKYKDEAVSIYLIENDSEISGITRYIVSTRETRNVMNYPEIVNIEFTDNMRNGITTVLKGINHLENLSSIDSHSVNVFHILRGGLNFQLSSALNKAFNYKWHSSSYISSQRVLKEGKFEISEDFYRKFIVPDNSTIYFADIVASGVSLDNALKYIDAYLETEQFNLKNLIFFTIGCIEGENVLNKWHKHFKEKSKNYEKTIICYLEGRFTIVKEKSELNNCIPYTDLLRNYKLGALLSPEFEYSQFEKVVIGLEECVIYDGGKKGFEPINHFQDIRDFWEKQLKTAEEKNLTIWDEYNVRFPLDNYFENVNNSKIGNVALLRNYKKAYWYDITENEYEKLFEKFRWLWNDERIDSSQKPGSLKELCKKKLRYLDIIKDESI